MMVGIKVVSHNVRGLNGKIKQKHYLSHLHKQKPDILLMQESHIKSPSHHLLKDKMFLYQLHFYGSSKARGVAVLINNSMHYKEVSTLKGNDGRLAATKGLLNGTKVTIVSIYAPNEGQAAYLKEAFQKIVTFAEGILICAGDFNYIADLAVDRTYHRGLSRILQPHKYTGLQTLLDSFGFVDCW